MVVRKRKKKNKMRGNRMHGGGNKKNRRGSGSRGGVGRAGSHKHKFSKFWMDFGVKRMFKAKEKGESINLEELSNNLERWENSGKTKSENGMIVVDGKILGFEKVLGKGNIKNKIKLENATASKKALAKIVKAGGLAQGIEGAEQEDEEFEAEESIGEVEGK